MCSSNFFILAVESEVCVSMSRASKLLPLTLAVWAMALLVVVRANGFNSTSCTSLLFLHNNIKWSHY